MNKNDECKIIQDLLPSYIDNLLSIESSSFVEEHIKSCKECSSALNNMKMELEKRQDNTKNEIKYAKKYNRKIKVLIAIIISLLLVIFCAKFVRNAIIITNLIKKSKQYDECQNFYVKEAGYTNEGISISETYFKDGKYIKNSYSYHMNQFETEEKPLRDSCYYDGDGKYITYSINEKKYWINNNIDASNYITYPKNVSVFQDLEEDFKLFIKACFSYNITSEKSNGKDCYRISYDSGIRKEFYDKDTGLIVKYEFLNLGENIGSEIDTTYDMQFEIGTVNDEDLVKPDVTEYTLIEN